MEIIEKLEKFGLTLPDASVPGGNYKSVNIRGNIAYLAIQFPVMNGNFLFQGRFGREISTQEGVKAMQLCALNVLSQVHKYVGFENISGLNHIDAYYQGSLGWDDAPIVVDGASNLFVEIMESRGYHSRAIFGVDTLPRNFCVGLTASFTLIP